MLQDMVTRYAQQVDRLRSATKTLNKVQTMTRMRRAKLRRTSAPKWRARVIVAAKHATTGGIVVRATEDATASVRVGAKAWRREGQVRHVRAARRGARQSVRGIYRVSRACRTCSKEKCVLTSTGVVVAACTEAAKCRCVIVGAEAPKASAARPKRHDGPSERESRVYSGRTQVAICVRGSRSGVVSARGRKMEMGDVRSRMREGALAGRKRAKPRSSNRCEQCARPELTRWMGGAAQRASRLNRESAVIKEAAVGMGKRDSARGEGQLFLWKLGYTR